MARRRESGLKFGDQEKKNAKQSRKERKAEQSGEFVMQPKKRHWGVLIAVTAVLLVAGVLVYLIARGNERLRITKVVVADARVPESFDGFRILQLSDFNGKSFGEGNRTLIETVAAEDFDIAVLTGDYIAPGGSLDTFEPVANLLEAMAELGKPVYYVLGENDVETPDNAPDGWNRCIEQRDSPVAQKLDELGAQCVYPITIIERGGARIFLTGITYYEKLFDSFSFDSDKDFSICVTHAPIDYDVDKRLESVNRYSFREIDFDMSISGHTLGGQYRLPLLKTLYLKGYGLFPQESYSYGLHKIQNRYSFITAGLGVKSGFRLCDSPEIAIIELHSS